MKGEKRNPVIHAIANNRVEVVKYFAEEMKCNMRLCLDVQEDEGPNSSDKNRCSIPALACINGGESTHMFSYLVNNIGYLWNREKDLQEIFLNLVKMHDFDRLKVFLESRLFKKYFESLANEEEQIVFMQFFIAKSNMS